MATITQVGESIQRVLGEQIEILARQTGFIQRQVTVTGCGFVQALVMAFQAERTASYSELSQAASSLGMPMSAQGMEQRLNERSADFMKAVLELAVQEKVHGITAPVFPILEKFQGVHIRDSSIIGLPAMLQEVWKGNGNRHGKYAALKLQVGWEYSHGALDGLRLQDGSAQDKSSPYQTMELPAGALHLGDLGYFSLEKLVRDSQNGVFWITRWRAKTRIWEPADHLLDLLNFLSAQPHNQVDLPVRVGTQQQLACRLIASRVPQEVADRRVRWQIEMLFKLWKTYLAIDKWNTSNPWRILTEMYAKLLTALLFHWTTLFDFWNYPDRSLFKAVLIFRKFIPAILFTLDNTQALLVTLQRLANCYAKSCRIVQHANFACTYQMLLHPLEAPLR